jgi:TonB family protein
VGHSVLRKLLGAQEQGHQPLSVTPSENGEQNDPVDLLAVLRQNLEEGSQPPAAVLHATAEAGRILSGADGLALALRTKGVIVCRARSGDPTPELGSPLSVDSGISGECVRSASILVCDDTSNDPRVDPEVCRFMGIQSIVVVPLRGPSGIAGILEAFSTRVGAFGEEQIDSLRGLAEIAEAAYQRECGTSKAALDSAKSLRRQTVVSSDSVPEPIAASQIEPVVRHSYARRYWVAGLAVTAMLLVAGVWLSGREPSPEAAAKEPMTPPHIVASGTSQPVSLEVSLPKPKAGIVRAERSPEKGAGISAAGTLKKAAEVETETTPQPDVATATMTPAARPAENKAASSAPSELVADPPTVTIAASEMRTQFTGMGSPSAALPTLEAKVSQGVVRGTLTHKVEPIYPAQAMKAHISGPVTLEVTIAENGTVRNVEKLNGSPVLMQAAADAVRQWRYSPSLLDNKPVEVHVQVTVLFKLPGEGNN